MVGERAPRTSANGKSALYWVRVLYVLVYASNGATGSYLGLFFSRVDLPNSEVGLLLGVQPIVMLISGPIWSMLADRLGLRARLLTLVLGLSILPSLAMAWGSNFVELLILMVLWSMMRGPVTPLMDSVALEHLGADRHRYGAIRGIGSLGFAAVCWATGLVIEWVDVRGIFVLSALLTAMACVVSLRLRSSRPALPTSVGRGLSTLIRRRQWLIIMAALFLAMVLQGVTFGFVNVYLDSLGASGALMGSTQAVGSVGQWVILTFLVPGFLRRWPSERLLLVALVAYGIRVGLWAAVPNAWVVGLSNLLTGLTMGVATVAAVDSAARYAPEGLEVTSQALASGLVSGLGRSAGGTVGGALYDDIGPRPTFALFSAFAGVVALAYGVAMRRTAPCPAERPATVEGPAAG